MNPTLEKTTHIGFGHAAHANAFQRGREAAQMAKSQLSNGKLELVVAFGPGNVQFIDFIEGVRLVTGEETLIGIPARHIFSTEQSALDSCYVLIIQSSTMRFSLAATEVQSNNILAGTTSIVSQIRQTRGNAIRSYTHRGLLLFQNNFPPSKKPLAQHISADLSLESWIAGGAPLLEKSCPFICRNTAVQNGLVAIECLSLMPWGMGWVGTGPFKNQADVHREAAKSALREALAQLQGRHPALGLILFDLPDNMPPDKLGAIMDGLSLVVPNAPVIGIPTQWRFLRSLNHSLKMEKESVVALLVPT